MIGRADIEGSKKQRRYERLAATSQLSLCRIPLVRTSSELAVRRPGKAPEGAVPSPSPGRHAGDPLSPRKQLEQSADSRRVRDWDPRAQPSEPILFPRPDAVMSTTGRGRHSVLRIFKGRRGRTGHRATCGALPAAGPYLRLSLPFTWNLSPLRPSKFSFEYLLLPPRSAPTAAPPGSRPRFCSDRRALLLIGAWHLPRRPGVGRALKRHPFSGLVDSAGELFTHSLADFDFHDHRPAVLIDQHPLWVLDERFARQYRCGPPPEFPLASPRSGIVHHLSGPDRHAHTRTLLRRSRSDSLVRVSRRAEWGAHRPVPGARRYIAETARAANHDRRDGISTSLSTARALAAAPIRTGPRPESIGGPAIAVPHPTGDASPAPIRFPPDNFKHSLTLFSKSFSSFPRGTCLLSVLTPVFSLGRNLPPYWGCIPKQPDSQTAPRGATGPGTTGLSPSLAPPSRGLGPGPPLRTLLQTTIRTARPSDFQAGLIPVRSPLLRESLASLTAHDARHNTRVFSTTTSRASTEGDSSLGQPHHKHGRPISAPMPCVPIRGCMVGGDAMRDAQAGVPSAGWLWAQLAFKNSMVHVHGSFCFAGFDNDPSAGSPTETLLRLLLPLNDKVQCNSRDVAGGEPPTSPRS
ncbi:hypothetical protein L1887_63146 [Cichorium endivia]|nr:hypothetical protein L1887_63146 [Cichorium endivia]